MLNIDHLTHAQKLHALKYGDWDGKCIRTGYQKDQFDNLIERFEELQTKIGPNEAYKQASQEVGKRYKNYKTFLVARAQYYEQRDRGRRPALATHIDRAKKRAERMDSAYRPNDSYWIITQDARRRGKTRYESWKLAEEWHQSVHGRIRYSSESSFRTGYYKFIELNRTNA